MFKTAGGMIRPHSSKIGYIHRLVDACSILTSLWLSVSVFYPVGFSPIYVQAGVWAVLVFLLIGGSRDLYSSWRISPMDEVVKESVIVWFWTALILLLIAFLTKSSAEYSRLAMMTWLFLALLFLALVRVLLRVFLNAIRQRGRNTRSLAIAGKTKLGLQLRDKVENTPWLGMHFVGFFDDRVAEREGVDSVASDEEVGSFDTLVQMARDGKLDYIYIALPMRAEARIIYLVNALSDTTASVYFVPNFFVFDLLHGKMTNLDGMAVLSLHDSPFSDVDGWVKRAEDLILGSLILALVAVPMLLIALAIKLTSTGPVLFKQKRFGLNGKEVDVFKFRTMRVVENGDVVVQAKKQDERVTPLGALLRKTSLDELPQFFNVIEGSMSIVGPRPHAVAHNEHYRKLIRGYMLRHKVKPGITGLAQVNGWRGETETLDKMAMRVKFDLDYVKQWSLWLDMKIIVLTVVRGFFDKNAY